MSATSFDELGCGPRLLRAVTEAGYTTPTPIQVQAIPVILAGKDVMGGAQTGTGKTAGFAPADPAEAAAAYANTSPSPARHPVRALILTPTRELAIQVEEADQGPTASTRTCARPSSSAASTSSSSCRSSAPASRSSSPRRDGCSTTSSRRASTSARSRSSCSTKPTACSTWASSRTSSGSWRCCRPRAKRQNLLFSATFSDEIKKLADQLLNAPQLIEVATRNTAAETVTQTRLQGARRTPSARCSSISSRSRNLSQVLCFVRTKHGASRLARQLEKDGLVTDGDPRRQDAAGADGSAAAFKEGKLQVLVATDVAARGLDIDDLPLVVNYELPHVPEDYIHRIGRTGRAGASGEAISFVAPDEEKYLAEIERLLKKKVSVEQADGFDADAAAARMPARERAPRSERRPSGRSSSSSAHSHSPVHAQPAAKSAASDEASHGARVRDRGEGHRDDGRSARERQRDEVYANNPDQPVVNRVASNGTQAKSALIHGAHGQRHGPGSKKAIPALLMKRRTPEPENA